MKAVLCNSTKLDYKIITKEIPKPSVGEVLVKVIVAPIHPSDPLRALSIFGPVSLPIQMGLEGYGEVIEENSNDVKEGSSLKGKYVGFWSLKAFTWAEYTVVPRDELIEAPKYEKKDYGLAANFFLNPITALGLVDIVKSGKYQSVAFNSGFSQVSKMIIQLLKQEGIKTLAIVRKEEQVKTLKTALGLVDIVKSGKYQSVAFNSGFSQVSKMIIQLLKQEGIKTLAIVRKEEQVKTLKDLGATVVLNSSDSSFVSDLKSNVASLGVKIFFDSVGGKGTTSILTELSEGTAVHTYGGVSGEPVDQKVVDELKEKRGFTFDRYFFLGYYKKLIPDQQKAVSEKIAKELNSTFKSDINKFVKLEEISSAFKEYNENMSKGKIIIEL
eukprot:CAMPEP_0170536004 /NCGR_PEP_ID=MMETSP0209-20121228/101910_1 /TAXON_ID=665100 ORGANISM="Litonotus pictus, Strain P1" /NCGR_SAMPLE_ID=MMETSP0209 /ASSEMBLY_ACC=CAM_ASM_000301 /LENGTH=383 /DNA_ID=CAMNT_0010837323 /DNA_START=10 /DNA_END=1161 /DNA_ORIENTATION=-